MTFGVNFNFMVKSQTLVPKISYLKIATVSDWTIRPSVAIWESGEDAAAKIAAQSYRWSGATIDSNNTLTLQDTGHEKFTNVLQDFGQEWHPNVFHVLLIQKITMQYAYHLNRFSKLVHKAFFKKKCAKKAQFEFSWLKLSASKALEQEEGNKGTLAKLKWKETAIFYLRKLFSTELSGFSRQTLNLTAEFHFCGKAISTQGWRLDKLWICLK